MRLTIEYLNVPRHQIPIFIVTGEKHLLSLREFDGIGITRIAGFLYIFENKDKSKT
jgi:hypothetical protein